MPKITVMKCGRCPRTFDATDEAVSMRIVLAKTTELEGELGRRGFESTMDVLRALDAPGDEPSIGRVVEYEDLCPYCANAATRFLNDYERAYTKPKRKRSRKPREKATGSAQEQPEAAPALAAGQDSVTLL